jgi:dipeptidyl aminopeptidase/acylaminoacyl peptidase
MRQFNLRSSKRALAAASLLLAAAAAPAARIERDGLVADGLAAASPALLAAWMRYRDSDGVRLLDWLADGSLLLAVSGTHGSQAARIAAPLAPPVAVPGADGLSDASAHPFDARRIALRRVDHPGHALLAVQDLDGAAVQTLEDAAARADTPLWAHDGQRLAFASDRANGAGYGVYVAEPGDAADAHLVTGGDGRWDVLDWSRDDRALLLRHELGAGDERLLVADVASGALTPIDAPAARSTERTRLPQARFTPDGGAILYLSDEGADGFVRLKLAALNGAPPRVLSPAMPHDVERFDISGDGRWLAYSWAEAGYSHVAVIDQRSHTAVPLPSGVPLGVVGALRFDRGGARLALEIATATTPAEVYVVDLTAATAERWTQSPVAGGTLQPAQRFRFRTWDRDAGRPRELAAFLYTPASAGAHPVLLLLHDGPAGEFRPGYDAWLQFLVNELGIAVVAPNLRGSGGAGRKFAALADGALREDATRDIGSLLVWLGAQPGLDATRVAIMGRGQGGYDALAALATFGDRLRGAVAIDPPADRQSLEFAGAMLRPALLAHLDAGAAGRRSDAEQLLWRMRADKREAAYLTVDAEKCTDDCRAAVAAARAAIAAYLQALLAGDAALSEPRAP